MSQSEETRKRWADPEWKARQRAKIARAMSGSIRHSQAQRERRARESAEADVEEKTTRQPWKPGDPKPDWLRRAGR